MSLSRTGLDPRDMLEALQAFADGSVAHHVATEMAVTGQGLVRRGFDQSKAPDGSAWRPLAASTLRGGPSRRPLRKTGRLAFVASQYSVDRTGFVMRSTDAGGWHQSEGVRTRLPRRAFYPDEAGPLPVGWWIALGSAAERAVADFVPR